MKITLKRIAQSEKGTFGVLIKDDVPLCVTCEDPWNNNATNISCIPAGEYDCTPHNGAKYSDTWILNKVPNRSAILFHAGNSIQDTQGCILVGRSFNSHTIRDSRNALDYLRTVLSDEFTLKIVDVITPEVFLTGVKSNTDKETGFFGFLTRLLS